MFQGKFSPLEYIHVTFLFSNESLTVVLKLAQTCQIPPLQPPD
jgi:hypothetical protein